MKGSLLKLSVIAMAIGALAGCKLTLVSTQGGSIQSKSGQKNCAETSVCTFEVKAANLDEVFVATPKAGWEFKAWKNGDGFLCGDSRDPTCFVSNTAAAGNPDGDAIIKSSTAFYLMPEFRYVGGEANGGDATAPVTPKSTVCLTVVTNERWNSPDIGDIVTLKNGASATVLSGNIGVSGAAFWFNDSRERWYVHTSSNVAYMSRVDVIQKQTSCLTPDRFKIQKRENTAGGNVAVTINGVDYLSFKTCPTFTPGKKVIFTKGDEYGSSVSTIALIPEDAAVCSLQPR